MRSQATILINILWSLYRKIMSRDTVRLSVRMRMKWLTDGIFAGSIQGPYRKGMADTSFPEYCPVETAFAGSQSYARSLLSLGNGMALYNPKGNQARSEEHQRQGALLGDVGHVYADGSFAFSFNIFLPAKHPIQRKMLPRNFTPLTPPLSDDESVSTIQHFPAGTVLASDGIRVSEKSTSPLWGMHK